MEKFERAYATITRSALTKIPIGSFRGMREAGVPRDVIDDINPLVDWRLELERDYWEIFVEDVT